MKRPALRLVRSARGRLQRAPSLAVMKRTFERQFERALDRRCKAPGTLGRAIRYAALSPGKRLRPLLTLAACDAVGGDWKRALPAAIAVECVHAFSLVHDDLPALDDDDYRRGRLTTHKKFGEATAILAGDALLAFAFEELARLAQAGVPPDRVVEAVSRLAHASGGERLVGGQALDLAAEGRRVTRSSVMNIHWNKTGALMGAATALGAIAGGASGRTATTLEVAANFLGLAFQIQDDLLNADSSLRRLGKRAGTDAARRKATYPKAAGVEASQHGIGVFVEVARNTIAEHCRRPRLLLALIQAMEARER